MAEEEQSLLRRMQDFLNYDMSGNTLQAGNVPVFDRPEPIEDPTTSQAIRQAVNTFPSIVKDVATGAVEMGKQVYEDPTLIVDAAKTVGNIVWNPNDVPFIAAIKSRLLRKTGSNDHVFNSAGENRVDEIEKPWDDYIASVKERYGENWKENVANNPEAFLMDGANLAGLTSATRLALLKLVPNKEAVLNIVDTVRPQPNLVPAVATAGGKSTSTGQQTKNLMPTIRETMAGPAAVDYDSDDLARALAMQKEGASAKKIFDETGRVATMRGGKEGYGFGDQFKFEIDDTKIIIDDSIPKKLMAKIDGPNADVSVLHGNAFYLDKLIPNHKELFTQYPKAKNISIRFLDPNQQAPDGIEPLGNSATAYYSPRNNEIVFQTKILNNFNTPKNRDTFFHELQHALQAQDALKISKKWLAGGLYTPIDFLKDPVNSFSKFHIQNLSKDKKMLEIREELRELGVQFSKDKSDKLANKLIYKWSEFKDKSFEIYLRTGIETEARVVGARSGLIGTESKNTLVKDLKRQEKIITKKSYYSNKPENYIEKVMERLGPSENISPALKTQYLNEAVEFITEYQNKKIDFESLSDDAIKEISDASGPDGFNEGGLNTSIRPKAAPKTLREKLLSSIQRASSEEEKEFFKTHPYYGEVLGNKVFINEDRLRQEGSSGNFVEEMLLGESLHKLKEVSPKDYLRLKDAAANDPAVEQWKQDSYKHQIQADPNYKTDIDTWWDESRLDQVIAGYLLGGADASLHTVRNWDKENLPFGTVFREELENFKSKLDTRGFAEGGSVNNMTRQMKMFEEGGIADDGMNRDPISGNEIPSGSLAKEVRDDIPAQLSEGEYVVPADVVRFFGVKYFEDLRMEAKMGLQKMEQDGRIGGEPMAQPMSSPVGDSSQVTDSDLAQLEQMLSTGVADGGLMDKMVMAAKNDRVINERMNANGMSVGFAEGGMTTDASASYADPTKVDAIISKVMAAVQQKPELLEELSKRGIKVSRTTPQMNAGAMQKANSPAQTTNLSTNTEESQSTRNAPPVMPQPIKAAAGVLALPNIQSIPNQSLDLNQSNKNFATSSTTGIPSYFSTPGGSYINASATGYQQPETEDTGTGGTGGVASAITSTAESCAAIGMRFDPETNTCVLIPIVNNNDDDSPPGIPEPVEFKFEKPEVDYFSMTPEELANVSTGKIDPFTKKAIQGAGLLAGGTALGAIALGSSLYTSYTEGTAISDMMTRQMVAESRGLTSEATAIGKAIEKAYNNASFLVQGAYNLGLINGQDNFAQQIAEYADENFKLDETKYKKDSAALKRAQEAAALAAKRIADAKAAAAATTPTSSSGGGGNDNTLPPGVSPTTSVTPPSRPTNLQTTGLLPAPTIDDDDDDDYNIGSGGEFANRGGLIARPKKKKKK